MRERELETAKHFGILDRMEDLEKELRKINHVVEVDFDLNGFWSDINQVIIIPKYDIPVSLSNYYDVRREMLKQIIDVANSFGLHNSGDRIEDYGEHLYIVRDCDSTWALRNKNQTTQDISKIYDCLDDKTALSDRIQLASAHIAKPLSATGANVKTVEPER